MNAVASLPMYDWPEVRAATDAWWAALRDALRARGLAAPEALARDAPHWEDAGLVLSQTCGMPYRLRLHGCVTLIGALDYGLAGCAPGWYRSALVVGAGDRRAAAADFAGSRFAWNAADSQSGRAALEEALGPLDPGRALVSGSHRGSIRAVARGEAEIAAIDAVSWRLAEAWEPAAAGVRVLGWTRPTPGLPLITAGGRDPEPYRAAVLAALEALGAASRAALGLRGFAAMEPAVYLAA